MRSSTQIREKFIERLNAMLARPTMWVMCDLDLEMQLNALIHDLWYIDDVELQQDFPIIEGLVKEGVYYPSNVVNGVGNVFKNIMPDIGRYYEYICSIYAREAHKAGYLDIKNILKHKTARWGPVHEKMEKAEMML